MGKDKSAQRSRQRVCKAQQKAEEALDEAALEAAFIETRADATFAAASMTGLASCISTPVPHDAREPCQFVFSDGSSRLGIATDLGSITPHVVSKLNNVDGLLLECNYDGDMLRNGIYPQKLKERVSGDKGHLDNKQATHLLKTIKLEKLKHLIGMHVSEKNNTLDFAMAALCEGMNCAKDEVSVACQIEGFAWRELA